MTRFLLLVAFLARKFVHLLLDPAELGEAYRRDALMAPKRLSARYQTTQ